jgi:hypothetical protein
MAQIGLFLFQTFTSPKVLKLDYLVLPAMSWVIFIDIGAACLPCFG